VLHNLASGHEPIGRRQFSITVEPKGGLNQLSRESGAAWPRFRLTKEVTVNKLCLIIITGSIVSSACAIIDEFSGVIENRVLATYLWGPSMVKAKEEFRVSGTVNVSGPITRIVPLVYYDKKEIFAEVFEKVNNNQYRDLVANFATFSATLSIEQPGIYKLSGIASYSTIIVE